MSRSPNPVAEPVLARACAAVDGSLLPIARLPTAVTAFVGRALKGLVNTPTVINSFGEFQHRFGGLWQPATLGYAVEQYFDNGGRQALIVRVANGARAPTLRLPAGDGALLLQAVAPGTREYLRASVDYDGISAVEADQFNLVLQTLRVPDSELVEEQEILPRVSIRREAERSVARVLSRSKLARVAAPLPTLRPERTCPKRLGQVIGYLAANADGTDGADLSDYDLIGDESAFSGLFALRSGPRFDLLCVPPLGREQDVGVATLWVASRLCREHQAMLIVDPPRHWDNAAAALAGTTHWAFRSDQALMYFPRLLTHDRLRGRVESFAPGGAAAGLLARGDETSPPWNPAAGVDPQLRSSFRLQCSLQDAERARLAQAGVNCFDPQRTATGVVRSARTFLPESAARGEMRHLSARRLSLWVQACVIEGTAWMRHAPGPESRGPESWQRAQTQVEAFLESLSALGAFAGRDSEERYFVICDARLNSPEAVASGRGSLLFGFAGWRAGEFQSFLVTHEAGLVPGPGLAPGRSTIRSVTINRLATSGVRVHEEIETAILRQLAADAAGL